jgi:hypothetical protein
VLEECFQTPIEGAIYAELIDRLRAEAAVVDNSALVHTAWDIGAPLNTVVWYFQLVAAEFRVIDCDSDLDLTPVQRVARPKATSTAATIYRTMRWPPCTVGKPS